MKKNIKAIQYAMFISLSVVLFSCQKIDKPGLGDYPKDTNPPGGPLKFYASFDGVTDNPLFNAVDSIKANFAANNPLTVIDGISGKAVKGETDKGVKYNSANDFGSNLSSYTISFWIKSGVPANNDEYEVPFSLAHDGLYYKAALHFDIYPGNQGSTAASASAYYYMEQPDGSYFEAYMTGSDGIPNLLDNAWHHLVFTYDETTSDFKVYKDAVQVYTKTWSGHGPIVVDPTKMIGLAIGGSNKQAGIAGANDGWMYSWRGGIDQFRLYGKKVLTQAEIQTLFASKL